MNEKREMWCWMFTVYKDGVEQERKVGVWYNKLRKGDNLRVYKDLLEDYPESKGYRLVHYSDKKVS